MAYYAEWLGGLVPERDRIGKLEVRYDPRDISHDSTSAIPTTARVACRSRAAMA